MAPTVKLKEMKPKFSKKKALVAVLGLAVASFLILEGSLRLFVLVTHKGIKEFDTQLDLYQGHPFIGYVLKPNFKLKRDRGGFSRSPRGFGAPYEITVNRLGFRGKEFSPLKKQEGVAYRVFCLGGSDTFGFSVNDEETWPARLEQKLREAFPEQRIEVINAGGPGYTTFHSLYNFHSRILDYEPDMIIVYHSWNDLKYLLYVSPEHPFVETGMGGDYEPPSWFAQILRKSYSYILLTAAIELWNITVQQHKEYETYVKGEKSKDLSYGFRLFERNLLGIAVLGRLHGVKVVLANPLTLVKPVNPESEVKEIKYSYTGLSMDELRAAFDHVNDILKAISKSEELDYVDLNQLVHSDLETLMDHIHPTPLGHEQIAEAFFQQLKKGIGEHLVAEPRESR